MFYGKLFWLLDTLNSRTFIESIKKQEFETGIHNWACHLKKKKYFTRFIIFYRKLMKHFIDVK